MDRDGAKQEVKRQWRILITGITAPAQRRVNGEVSYICPLCRHGTHGDGLTVNKRSDQEGALKCFGCGFAGDIIDLYQRCNNVDYNAALSELAGRLGIMIDPYRPDAASPARPQDAAQQDAAQPQTTPQEQAAPDYTQYYLDRAKEIDGAADYLGSRGISLDMARRYHLGYDPQADPASAPGGNGEIRHPAKRLIIPVSKGCYIARSTDPDTAPQYAKMYPQGARIGIFNARCLYEDVGYIYVVEGAIDALSVIEVGHNAVALNSTSNTGILIDMLRQRPTKATLLICLDNDAAGKAAADKLCSGLQDINISYLSADICGGHKDPNEYLVADRAGFAAALAAAERGASTKPDNTADYINNLMWGEIERFAAARPTGFAALDNKSGGGLYPGLYVVAAISSLGKTTLCHQIADQLAEDGSDVIYYSLEQSRLELVSKSLVRRIAAKDPFTGITSLSIRRGDNRDAAQAAARDYIAAVGDRLSIVEGSIDCSVTYIGDHLRQYIRRNGTRPVVIIDYLQILQPPAGSERQGVRESIDMTVTALKRLSRDLDVTIIVISSVNRANYMTPIDLESLKESGGIEYTADVVWGLQLRVLHDDIFGGEGRIKDKRDKVRAAKAATPRQLELVCLKNRYGVSSYTVGLDYYPAIDLIRESGADDGFAPVRDSATPFDPRR